ncbi:STAS domain-containing protein [Kitasatospora sp. NPDC127067]|uniref:STAS domain-containing protein n=1 Tax=unclassified Kitasatospora TaxID=2633591 RepID=UPI0036531328
MIVQVQGDVDQETRRTLDDALAEAITARPPLLVVDLAGLAFCYSACVNALLAARLNAIAAGIEMVLAAARPQTIRVLTLTETDRLFTLHDSVRSALAGGDAADRQTGLAAVMLTASRYVGVVGPQRAGQLQGSLDGPGHRG